MKPGTLFKIYILSALVYLPMLVFAEDWAWFAKPLLLPSIVAAVANSGRFPTRRLLVWALLFSWFGDMVLMFADKGESYFIVGLVLFLTAHILYIVLFVRQTHRWSFSGLFWLGLLAVAVYLIGMLYVLYPTLGGLKIPVTVYAVVISAMLLAAFHSSLAWEHRGKLYMLSGAVCFVLSDSLLALNKFKAPLPQASFWIMATYLAAQLLIAYGVLSLNKKQQAVAAPAAFS